MIPEISRCGLDSLALSLPLFRPSKQSSPPSPLDIPSEFLNQTVPVKSDYSLSLPKSPIHISIFAATAANTVKSPNLSNRTKDGPII